MRMINVNRSKTVGALMFLALLLFSVPGNIPAQEAHSISMDFQEASLKDILKVFSQQAGLNFVATENIENKQITLYLDGVTVQDALDSIMKANNLTYDQAPGSAVFVVRESGKAKINLMTKVYTLDFARVSGPKNANDSGSQMSDIENILKGLLSKGEGGQALGTVIIDKRTNSVIITSIPEDFPLVEETISKLDALTPQALIEAEIVEIRTGALKKLGLEWGDGSSGAFVRFSGPTKITHFPFIRQKNPFSKSLLGGVTETTDTTATSTGVTTTSTAISQTPTLGTLSLAEFTIVLKALENEGMARYLAKPRIMALNNETAEIKITSDTTVGVRRTSVTDTGEVIEEAERIETGVTLQVTPTINRQGYITMTLQPEVSRANKSDYFANFVDPSKRSAKTTVMVKDGQTVAIGGLIRTTDEDDMRKTPYLSNIPLLGNLFKRNEKVKAETEIIIFITAHAINDVDDLETDVNKTLETEPIEAPVDTSFAETMDEPAADSREEQIRKTVMKLRKKRELSDDNK